MWKEICMTDFFKNLQSACNRHMLRRKGKLAVSKKSREKQFIGPEDESKTFGDGLNFAASEAYRLLRTNVLFALPYATLPEGQTCRIIGITSSLSGEGKSTTALNLSYMLAGSGRRVLLVEADMRLPTISRRLGLSFETGLSNLLAGLCGEKDVIQPSGISENLWVMGAGATPPNPSEMLGADGLKTVLKDLSSFYDFMILDLPPVTEVTDALVASRLVHGMILVVRRDYATRSSLGETMRQLEHVNAKVLGFVMTHADSPEKRYKSYGYGYGKKGEAAGGD